MQQGHLVHQSMVHPEGALSQWVLHLRSVDAGAATPKNTKKATIRQKNSEAYLHIKSMVHPEGALCKMGATLTGC